MKIDLSTIEQWYHPKQKDSYISGHDLYAHLKENNLLEDCLTSENLEEIRKLGLEEFNKYFKGKYVYGWKSVQLRSGRLNVPYLCEGGDEVVVSWDWLGYDFRSSNPALRFGKQPSALKPSKLLDPLPFELPPTLVINGVTYIKQ